MIHEKQAGAADLLRTLVTTGLVDVAIGLFGIGAAAVWRKKLSGDARDVDPELAKKLFADYAQAHPDELALQAVPRKALERSARGLADNAAFIPQIGMVVGDGKLLERPAVVAHELGHARRHAEGKLSSRAYAASNVAGVAARAAASLAGRPDLAWAAALFDVLPLYEEWRASGYAKDVLAKAMSPEDAARASRLLNDAFKTYLATSAASSAAAAFMARVFKK